MPGVAAMAAFSCSMKQLRSSDASSCDAAKRRVHSRIAAGAVAGARLRDRRRRTCRPVLKPPTRRRCGRRPSRRSGALEPPPALTARSAGRNCIAQQKKQNVGAPMLLASVEHVALCCEGGDERRGAPVCAAMRSPTCGRANEGRRRIGASPAAQSCGGHSSNAAWRRQRATTRPRSTCCHRFGCPTALATLATAQRRHARSETLELGAAAGRPRAARVRAGVAPCRRGHGSRLHRCPRSRRRPEKEQSMRAP